MRKITVGPKKSEGKTWFSQLSDKSKDKILSVRLAQLKFTYHLCILMTTCVIRKECENIFVLGDEKLWW